MWFLSEVAVSFTPSEALEIKFPSISHSSQPDTISIPCPPLPTAEQINITWSTSVKLNPSEVLASEESNPETVLTLFQTKPCPPALTEFTDSQSLSPTFVNSKPLEVEEALRTLSKVNLETLLK